MRSRRLPLLFLAAAALPAETARAHVNGAIAKANFTHPQPWVEQLHDGGSTWEYAPEDADQSFHVEWLDGDADPTARFTFYYLDHLVPKEVSASPDGMSGMSQIQAVAKGVVRDTMGRDADGVWASCNCAEDAGVVCPDAGMRWCDNHVDWDTSNVPDGAYWLVAVNNDPPYHVFNPSMAPVRVSHQGRPSPPVVIVLKPDGLGSADRSFLTRVIAVGKPPLTADLSWGLDNMKTVLGPTHTIAKALPVAAGGDGTWTYAWDTAALADDVYFLRVTLHDGAGGSSYSDSLYGLSVYHKPGEDDAGVAPAGDLGGVVHLPGAKPSGCGCAVAARSVPPLPLALLLPLALGYRRRRAR